jgi:hypothetical protein
MSGIGSPDTGSPAEIPISTPIHVEQNSNTAEAAEAEHADTREKSVIDPEATVIEDQAPYDDTVLEDHLTPEEVANIKRARANLGSANSDTTFHEDQSPESKPEAGIVEPITFAGKPKNFYVDLVDENDQPIPVAIPEAPPTILQRIGHIASKFLSRR